MEKLLLTRKEAAQALNISVDPLDMLQEQWQDPRRQHRCQGVLLPR